MSRLLSHWGNITVGIPHDREQTPLRNRLDLEFADSRTFSQALFKEFARGGRRTVTAKLVEDKTGFPWSPSKSASSKRGKIRVAKKIAPMNSEHSQRITATAND